MSYPRARRTGSMRPRPSKGTWRKARTRGMVWIRRKVGEMYSPRRRRGRRGDRGEDKRQNEGRWRGESHVLREKGRGGSGERRGTTKKQPGGASTPGFGPAGSGLGFRRSGRCRGRGLRRAFGGRRVSSAGA